MNPFCSDCLLQQQLLLLLLFLAYASSKCIPIKNCTTAQNYMKFRTNNSTIKLWLRNAACGFDDSQNPKIQCDILPPFSDCIPIQQCPFAKQTLYKSVKLQKPVPKNFISSLCGTKFDFINCIDYSKKRLESTLDKNCGVIDNSYVLRIGYGEFANIADFPWVALFKYDTTKNRTITCAGVLISKRYVVTAGHCLDGHQKNISTVRFGVYNKTDYNDGNNYKIKKWHIHPDFDKKTSKSDIALVRLGKLLQRDMNKNFTEKPICLRRNLITQLNSNESLIISGFGELEGHVKQDLLQKGVVYLRSNASELNITNSIYKNDKIIANSPHLTDTCQGDSGGPIMVEKNRTYLLGVTSLGSRKCGEGGLYTNIANYTDWLLESMVADELNLYLGKTRRKTKNKKLIKTKNNF